MTQAMHRYSHPDFSVLVTGGARRLGATICESFARAGWHVWCQYKNSGIDAHNLCAGLRNEGHRADAIEADIGTETGRMALVDQISIARPLRSIVNNASAFEPDTGLDFDPETAARQIGVNLIAPLALARLLAQRVDPDDGLDRSVIHILDQKVFNLNPDYFSYTVSKLALERAVALQAQSLSGVRVCGVAPGILFPSGPQSLQNFQIASSVNPLRRPIDPADVASTCVFIAGTRSLNGTTVIVDNGQHLIPLERDIMFVVDELQRKEFDAIGIGQ